MKRFISYVFALVAGFLLLVAGQAAAQVTSNWIQGMVGSGTDATGVRPVLIGGYLNNGTTAQKISVSAAGALAIASGGVVDVTTATGVLTSNGATPVTIAAAPGGAIKSYILKLGAYNVSTTVGHSLTITDTGGNVLVQQTLGFGSSALTGGNFILDDDSYAVQTSPGLGLQFKIDGGGAGTDVILWAIYVQK